MTFYQREDVEAPASAPNAQPRAVGDLVLSAKSRSCVSAIDRLRTSGCLNEEAWSCRGSQRPRCRAEKTPPQRGLRGNGGENDLCCVSNSIRND